jgi:tetratricopeptide (TPR) repeat protein
VKLPTSIPSAEQTQLLESLGRIEVGIWIIAVLLLVIVVLMMETLFRKQKDTSSEADSGWSKTIEKYYDEGKSAKAIDMLKVSEAVTPKNPSIKWWLGRFYFQQEEWSLSAQKFEECLRLDPYFRNSVKDYMSFIELNELVAGVSGYISAKDS